MYGKYVMHAKFSLVDFRLVQSRIRPQKRILDHNSITKTIFAVLGSGQTVYNIVVATWNILLISVLLSKNKEVVGRNDSVASTVLYSLTPALESVISFILVLL